MPPKTHRDRQLGSQNSSWGRLGRLGCVLGSSRRRLGDLLGASGGPPAGLLGFFAGILPLLGAKGAPKGPEEAPKRHQEASRRLPERPPKDPKCHQHTQK